MVWLKAMHCGGVFSRQSARFLSLISADHVPAVLQTPPLSLASNSRSGLSNFIRATCWPRKHNVTFSRSFSRTDDLESQPRGDGQTKKIKPVFNPKKVAVLTKMTRYDYEKRLHCYWTEEELERYVS
jgi:hypothetical protein